jgi:hypothetical protein
MSFELEAACIFHGRAGSVASAACNLAAAACSLHRVTMQDSKNEQASSYYDCTAHCSALASAAAAAACGACSLAAGSEGIGHRTRALCVYS